MDPDELGLWATSEANALEWLLLDLARREARNSTTAISLPVPIARLISSAASRGLNIGKGRRRPSATPGDLARQQAVHQFYLQRKRELTRGLKGSARRRAEDQAFEEARSLAAERHGGFSATIIRRGVRDKSRLNVVD